MDTVKKVDILIQEVPNIVRTVVWSTEPHETTLLVVSFDIDAVRRISRRMERDFGKMERLICPAKYAALWNEDRGDIGIIAQNLVTIKRCREQAVWFEAFRDLPYAVDELRKKFPEKTIPNFVTCLIDWPFDRRKLSPGATLIATTTKTLGKR